MLTDDLPTSEKHDMISTMSRAPIFKTHDGTIVELPLTGTPRPIPVPAQRAQAIAATTAAIAPTPPAAYACRAMHVLLLPCDGNGGWGVVCCWTVTTRARVCADRLLCSCRLALFFFHSGRRLRRRRLPTVFRRRKRSERRRV